MQTPPTVLSANTCFGGTQKIYQHDSHSTGLPMRFSVFTPPQAANGLVPALLYMAGLTCTEETFPIKGGAQRVAAELGVMLIAPDTSPRDATISGWSSDWDFGAGAGFYLNATQTPWAQHFQMESYVIQELIPAAKELGADPKRLGITGHSMGGHGALTLALKYPGVFQSVSAFAPICAPVLCPWGQKAFNGYLGNDTSQWAVHDASLLMAKASCSYPNGILIDQGLDDKFLAEQLYPEAFESACAKAGQPLTLRRHAGYDHGYYFIQTFVEDHLRFHCGLRG